MEILKPLRRASLLIAAFAALSQSAGADKLEAKPGLKISYALSNVVAQAEAPDDKDLWARIRAGFKLPESDPRLTRTHEQWYAGRPASLERAVQRSRPYLFHIVEEVEKRGMPMEIALLPMIESAFNPQALSPQKASGIWQFIPATGRVFGLQQNEWYDGRRDILQSTRAALDYLQTLHRMFGDWELALAAYNCGEGCVGRALARAGDRRYANLKLPTETRHYVPKLVAVRNILQDPERFGFNLEAMANEHYFMQVNLSYPMEARQAARLAEMSLEEFLTLNPAFNRRVIHTDTRGVLLLPADRVETFQFNLHQKGSDKRLQSYRARQGESVNAIASKFGVSLAWLKENNPLKLYKGTVAKAQTLVVPQAQAGKSGANVATVATPAARPAMRTHTVRKGDTLSAVAQRYNVKISDIRRWNENAEPLRPGSQLTIPEITG